MEAKELLEKLEENNKKMKDAFGSEFHRYMKQKKDACRHTDGGLGSEEAASFVHQGVSRITLTSEQFHDINPTAANYFFGFSSFQEMKVYYESFYPDRKDFKL